MKKRRAAIFATALLLALFMSACGPIRFFEEDGEKNLKQEQTEKDRQQKLEEITLIGQNSETNGMTDGKTGTGETERTSQNTNDPNARPVPDDEDQKDDADKAEKSYTVTVDQLNIRQRAHKNAEVVGTLKKDDEVTIVENTDDFWVKIKAGTQTGYVAKQYLKEKSAAENRKPSEHGAQTNGGETEVYYVQVDQLNLRARPSTESDVLAKLSRNDRVELVPGTENGDWVKVKIANKTGYVSKTYLGREKTQP